MKKLSVYIIISAIFVLISCTKDEVFGVYQARFKEKGTQHYVELFPDSTFCHVYIKNDVRNEHRGKFRYYKDGNYRYFIDFDDWIDFDEKSIELKKHMFFGKDNILINKGQMFFDLDLYELNFIKE